ncbi:MAG TPA: CPBP family intramembrane glutamic endopeptidase, partial [Thermoanaerobaculia bacterium]|nr:CPBP family intramembrane glutamic endopeptidase [Thermoanaerobaculia bacterium]
RGFLVPGLAAGRPGAVGAVLVSAGLFAATHGGQYDLFDLSFVFALGLIFALCRLHTNSTWLCILLHAAVNGLAAWQFVELAG